MPIPAEIAEARRSARPVRVFRSDGEVIVLHVLDCDVDLIVRAKSA